MLHFAFLFRQGMHAILCGQLSTHDWILVRNRTFVSTMVWRVCLGRVPSDGSWFRALVIHLSISHRDTIEKLGNWWILDSA